MSTTALVCVLMPIPGAPGAPVFNGDRASDFLVLVEQLGTQAGITDKDLLVEWIVRYSTIDVRDTIQWMEQFDPDEDDKTWDAAVECLKSLYASRDKAPQVTRKDLENFYDVDNYRIKFSKFSAPLVKNKKITKEERNYYFVTGLPNATLEWFHNQLDPQQRYVNSAPSVDDAPWTTSADKTKRVRFDLDGQRIDPNEDKDTSTQNKKESSNPSSSSSVDDLAKHFKDMRIDQASMKTALNEITRALRRDSNPTLHSSQTNQPPYEILRRCFICGETNSHPMHPSRCHLMPGLLRDHLVIINPNNQRYQLSSGNDLPKLPRDYEGGVEAFLRRQQNTGSDFRREQPPHMGNQTSNSANVSNIELSYGGVDVFTSDVFAMSAPDSYDSSAYPTLRTGKDTSRRYDPKARPRTDDQAKSTRTPSSNRPPVPTPPQEPSTSTQRPPQLPAQKPIEVVPPNHPINREEGWKASKPSNNKGKEKEKEDVSMRDVTGKPGPSYHFTSTLSEKTDANEICNKIFDTQISIPIGHLIGVSPQLQKFVTEQTRTKREYKSKPAEYSYNFESNYGVEEEEYEPVYPSNVGVGNFEELPSFLVKYSNAVTTNPEKFYAMVTGKMEVTINGVSLTAMIDSGSELNLISRDVPDRVGLPIDFEGMKWMLRGVNGGPERLRGVVTDVPMMIGKHKFPHHHFVSNTQLESQDIILGQPFITWYVARMDYTRLGKAKIYLWKDGDKSVPPTLSIVITDPANKRNTTVIDRTANHSRYDLDDEDF
ncbi:hypothetical protein K435DRAFT_853437 [Dendrothele bispora CBS 962.96]|uniref:DUF4100 domain-containing protein n=1 Tax=Dendrothele bispora (strain CBS 962.96) TaxID=1314807 RepID=A0A4S8MGF3_DENBC|nr:hypothetical protein K435DRAFT_853437 [Dendrothele bispora CBS 962.96]